MEQFKRAQCILLPTNKADNALVKSVSKLYFFKGYFTQDYLQSQDKVSFHLYIISDDEIKEGDWFYDNNIISINKCENNRHAFDLNNQNGIKKIIATTDTTLKLNNFILDTLRSGFEEKHLPQPSQQFIEKYIESYNKGKVITDILVEYEHYDEYGNYISGDIIRNNDILKLKVNFKDNTITIKKIKDSWNREELIIKIRKYAKDSLDVDKYKDVFFTNKWIEKNL